MDAYNNDPKAGSVDIKETLSEILELQEYFNVLVLEVGAQVFISLLYFLM